MKYLTLIGIALTIAGIYFWEWALVRIASRPAPQPTPSPSIDRRTYAEGRPTLPSEVEPMVEYTRRRRSLYCSLSVRVQTVTAPKPLAKRRAVHRPCPVTVLQNECPVIREK